METTQIQIIVPTLYFQSRYYLVEKRIFKSLTLRFDEKQLKFLMF